MKIARIYFTKKYLSEWYGIKEEDFVISNVTGGYDNVEFDLIINDNAEISTLETEEAKENIEIRRQRLKGEM